MDTEVNAVQTETPEVTGHSRGCNVTRLRKTVMEDERQTVLALVSVSVI